MGFWDRGTWTGNFCICGEVPSDAPCTLAYVLETSIVDVTFALPTVPACPTSLGWLALSTNIGAGVQDGNALKVNGVSYEEEMWKYVVCAVAPHFCIYGRRRAWVQGWSNGGHDF